MTQTANQSISSASKLADDKGNIKLVSPAFGVILNFIHAGTGTDDRGKPLAWDDGIKISVPTIGEKIGIVKVSAAQLAFIRDSLKIPEVAAELDRRLANEKAAMAAALGAL